MKDYKQLAYHHCMATMVTNGTEGRDILLLFSPKSFEVLFPHSWESLFCMHHPTLALSVLSSPLFLWYRHLFFKPQTLLFLTLSSAPLVASAVYAINLFATALPTFLVSLILSLLHTPHLKCPSLAYTSGLRIFLL